MPVIHYWLGINFKIIVSNTDFLCDHCETLVPSVFKSEELVRFFNTERTKIEAAQRTQYT